MKHTTKFYCEETRELKSLKEWEIWFKTHGNHDTDGWNDFDSWFYDMVKDNLLSKCNVVTEFEIEEEQVVICVYFENDRIDYFSINFRNADYSVSGSWQEITEEFYDSYTAPLSDYVKLNELF